MEEIRNVTFNGYRVVSLFAGCGGSSLGYRMAGFKVVWASEFVEAARRVYLDNCDGTPVDPRDIRDIDIVSLRKSSGGSLDNLDVLDGSPPCSSYSAAGKREAGWNEGRKYSDAHQRTDDLFGEYVRFVAGLKPKVFVAENVPGLVRGAAKGMFLEISKALEDCGYEVRARLLDAQWLGVPQSRERLFIIGVRADLNRYPVLPDPLGYRYVIADALPVSGEIEPETDIAKYAVGDAYDSLNQGGRSDRYFQLKREDWNLPCRTITAGGGNTSRASITHPKEKRKFSIAELKALSGFPADFRLSGTYEQQYERIGRAVPPVMMAHIAATIRDRILIA